MRAYLTDENATSEGREEGAHLRYVRRHRVEACGCVVMLSYVISCYVMLRSVMLCHIMLCCAVLCYTASL